MSTKGVPSANSQSLKDKQDAVTRTAQISWLLREQLRASLPTSDEQFMTDYISSATAGNDDADKDVAVQLHEAMLVNDMPATGGVQPLLQSTPSGTTIGIDSPKDPSDPHDPQARFQKAMEWLSTGNPDGSSPLSRYKEYQALHTAALQERSTAYNDARRESRALFPNAPKLQEEHYNQWFQDHVKSYNNKVQAAYMEWVVHGDKERVEYNFALVDTTSPSERVEKSKESMRNSVISTLDGSAEFNRVILEPSNWAILAQEAANRTLVPPERTPDDIQFEINRAKFTEAALVARSNLQEPSASSDDPVIDETALQGAISGLLLSSRKYDEAHKDVLKESANTTPATSHPEDETHTKPDPKLDNAKAADKAAADALATARANVLKEQQAYTAKASAQLRLRISNQSDQAFTDRKKDVETELTSVRKTIADLTDELKIVLAKSIGVSGPVAEVLPSDPSQPLQETPANGNISANYWTRITCEGHQDSTSYSVGFAASYGLFSIGGSYSHADATGKAASQMSKLSCSISFDAMRVDITRPWLQADLFYDASLDAAPAAKISPGPFFLHMLIDQANEMPTGLSIDPTIKAKALKEYSLFPHFSTAFILATNLVLEFKGETADISSYFHSDQNSASLSVGYGPFSISGSYSHQSSDQNSTCQTTSDGCRITVKAPQIIGWVSQILPPLPRPKDGARPFDINGWPMASN
ncbi:hypothetical protein M408DRAFT_29161 [Serendipita vermifera MAFF 305830]|uniref:Uncharacterized protein n=1 Tax=Serendipita vermifera MAFF 305830 TaxID=933852 RepID=A0A0C2W628_SERVB|nr:hypothetical protein M408DRAFT_29161 [Serendipita vermifera MAFF 305830]